MDFQLYALQNNDDTTPLQLTFIQSALRAVLNLT